MRRSSKRACSSVRPIPPSATRPLPEWAALREELKRKGVTLQLLWLEYKAQHPDGYQYTPFCEHYRTWAATLEPTLRQVHVAGERVFVDYAGPTMPVFDRTTGEERAAQIFVAALGASHLLYAEATWTQTLPDWIGAHVRMLDYYGGVPALIVPGQRERAGVQHACYDEPDLNPTYQDFATHYGTAILPTRIRSPRDKAKVETAVQIVEREIMAPLRHEHFTSLAELNHAIAFALERVNTRPFQKLAGSRRSVFDATERTALRPLPSTRFELSDWRTAKVNIDYHIAVDRHLYSVPYTLIGATVDVRLTTTTVEILLDGKRVAAHVRSTRKGRATTDPSHRPKSHQTPPRVESVAPHPLGEKHRTVDRPRRHPHPRTLSAPGARLPRVSRSALAPAAVRPRATRGRLHARGGHRRDELSLRQIDSHHRRRSTLARRNRRTAARRQHTAPAAHRACARPRPGVLPPRTLHARVGPHPHGSLPY